MTLVRSVVAVAFVAVLAAAFAAGPAVAAPLPVQLGGVGSSFTTGSATAAGGCRCTVAQMQSPTGNPYTIPYDGVIVSSGTYVGNTVEAGDSVQVQTVHKTGATTGNVVSEGIAHGLLSLPTGAVSRFLDRVPAHAGDVLAARFNDSGFIESTPFFFKSTAATDSVQESEPTTAGNALAGGFSVPERRVNLEAVLEPDEDGDGYGDVSQDLCPGSPIATGPCSGSLFGSDLQGGLSNPPLACLHACLYVQTSLGGVSTAATTPGVIVRWRILNTVSGAYRIHVLTDYPEGSGGGSRAYHVVGTSETVNVAAPLNPVFSKISSFPTRLPIPVGGYVGVTVPGGFPGFQSSPGGQATYTRGEAPFPGLTGVVGATANGTILYDADIEPDVDGDGYGDVTQDSCPSSAAVHEGPCPVAPPAAAGGGTGVVGTGPGTRAKPPAPKQPPTIRSLSAKPKSFHAKPLGKVPSGGAWGTKVTYSVSAPATVSLAIEARHGRRFQLVTRLTRKSPAGRSTVPFSGQYRHGGKLVDLAPGTYRLSATARDGSGTGPPRRAAFVVLPSE